MATDSHRLSILTDAEIEDLYGLPRFTEDDRRLYFDLSPDEQKAAATYTPAIAAHFVLQLGFCKARQLFIVYEEEDVRDDLNHIVKRHFPDMDLARVKTLSKPTRLAQQQAILELTRYRLCDSAEKLELERKAQRSARLSAQPIFILREVLHHLTQQRIVAPAYKTLQDMVGRVVARERDRLSQLLTAKLTPPVRRHLDKLREGDEHIYRISTLRKEPRDFSYKELQREVDHRKVFQPLHEFAKTFFVTAAISMDSRRYYASLVTFYTVFRLKRMAIGPAQLYLLCFAYYRFRQINDNLVEAFIHLVHEYEQQAKVAAEQAVQQALSDSAGNLPAAGQVLQLFVDPSLPDNTPFGVVKKKAFSLLRPDRFRLVSDYLGSTKFDRASFEWASYPKLPHKLKRNLRHLFREIEFSGYLEKSPLMKAVNFLQNLLRQGKLPHQAKLSDFPPAFIPKNWRPYLFTRNGKERKLVVDRYEFAVYRMLRNALESGDVFVKDSAEFRSLEDDLISDERWKNKDAYCVILLDGRPDEAMTLARPFCGNQSKRP
jgi:hypothetical protein